METLIGPTLLDRANYIGSTLTEIASIFFLRGAGYVVGGAVMGTLGDQFKQHTYLLLCVALLWSIVSKYKGLWCVHWSAPPIITPIITTICTPASGHSEGRGYPWEGLWWEGLSMGELSRGG